MGGGADMAIKKGSWVDTPRFCKVKIEKVFSSMENAAKQMLESQPKFGM